MKGNIIYSSWDSDTYTAIVKKQTKYGTFTGISKAYSTDKDIATSFIGYTIAEAKCDLQAFHRKVLMYEQRADGIRIALDNILQDDKVHEIEWWNCYNKLKRQYEAANKEAIKLRKLYNRRKEKFNTIINDIIEQRKKVLTKIKELEESK